MNNSLKSNTGMRPSLKFEKLKLWAHRLKLEIIAIYIASKDARTPVLAKLLAVAVVGYALSPIDLIPDFIPVLGMLDDLIIVPAGIAIIVRLIPHDLMASYRQKAKSQNKPLANWKAAWFVIALWILLALFLVRLVLPD